MYVILYNRGEKSGKGVFKMEKTMCVLDETKECDNCMECETCDLDPDKICDNCGKCLEIKEFASIKIDKIYTDPKDYKEDK